MTSRAAQIVVGSKHGVVPLHRVSIRRRLTLCFSFIFLLMLASNAFLLWQLHLVRVQADRLIAVDQELIAVLRFQNSLRNFHDRLNDLAQSKDTAHLLRESEILRNSLLNDAKRTQTSFSGSSPEGKLDPSVMATLESVQSALPSHLDAIRALALSGDWVAIRVRLANQIQPLEFLSSELVKAVDLEAHLKERKRRQTFVVPSSECFSLFRELHSLLCSLPAFWPLQLLEAYPSRSGA